MGRPWRWRRCPSCGKVSKAGDLINHHTGAAWDDGEAETECPYCGFYGVRSDFRVVREDHGDRLTAKGAAIRALRGIRSVNFPHQHRWSKHLSPLCIDCGVAQ